MDELTAMTSAEVRAWRESHNLTQARMGALLGLRSGAVTIGSWENGRSAPLPMLRLALERLDQTLPVQQGDDPHTHPELDL